MPTAENIVAYPLQWPFRVPRTKGNRPKSQFGKRAWNHSIDELLAELKRLGVERKTIVISTNQPVRNDGQPYAQTRRIDDPGVAVYFSLLGRQMCFPCDRWDSIAENMRAITLHIESMRGQSRWGVGTIDQAFAGYAALPASTEENWWDVLECRRDATEEVIQAQYRVRRKSAHPDQGGSVAAMQRLNTARDRALAEVR